VLVNQDDHKVFDLIESREAEAVTDLLKKYPYIKKVTRDGSKTYALAISEALPNAIQISDRFHLFKNFTDALKSDLALILPAYIPGSDAENDNSICENLSLTKKEQDELERHFKKQELAAAIRKRYDECGRKNIIQKEFDLSYRTVNKYLNNDPVLVKYEKVSSLTPYFWVIYESFMADENSYQTFRKIKDMGYPGTYSNMAKYIRLKKRKGILSKNGGVPKMYMLKLLYNKGIFDLPIKSEWQYILLNYLKRNKKIHSRIMLATEFRIAIFSKDAKQLCDWIEKAKGFKDLKKVQSFINGMESDIEAVKNAVIYDETNGVVEGAVCKIKKIKRVHYGRCKFDLLRQKILMQNQPN
jgi:transposase